MPIRKCKLPSNRIDSDWQDGGKKTINKRARRHYSFVDKTLNLPVRYRNYVRGESKTRHYRRERYLISFGYSNHTVHVLQKKKTKLITRPDGKRPYKRSRTVRELTTNRWSVVGENETRTTAFRKLHKICHVSRANVLRESDSRASTCLPRDRPPPQPPPGNLGQRPTPTSVRVSRSAYDGGHVRDDRASARGVVRERERG